MFKYGVIKSSLKSSTGWLKGIQGKEERSRNTRMGTWNWLIKGAILNPRVRSAPCTALSSTSVCDSTSNPNISTYWGKIFPPDCSKHLEEGKILSKASWGVPWWLGGFRVQHHCNSSGPWPGNIRNMRNIPQNKRPTLFKTQCHERLRNCSRIKET